MKDETLLNGIEVGGSTLVGYLAREFPISGNGGNCFTMILENGLSLQILNFGLENLEELVRRGLTWPVKVIRISGDYGVVCDGRIGDRWYNQEPCSVCTPADLIPIPQRLKQLRRCERGVRKETPTTIRGRRTILVSEEIGNKDKPQFE